MQQISKVIPKVTPADFQKIMRNIGANRYEQISSSTIIMYAPASSRNARKEILQNLAELLKDRGAEYTSKTNISGSGHVEIAGTGGKIALKPERIAGGIILKPNIFGQGSIVDVEIPYGSYESTLISAIQNTKKLNDLQKELLITITESVSDTSAQKKSQLRKLFSTIGNQISINTINNDFGEVLGPIAIGRKNLLPIDFGSAKVFIPGRSNEPLLDYKLTDKNNIWKISAKSGTTTNTLKPGDVVMLIDKEKFYREKWKNSPQLTVLDMLDKGTTKQGPIDTALWLKKNGYESYFDWLESRDYTEETRQKSEDTIVKISREALSFTEIFSDATKAKIYYIKFRMYTGGNMEWKLVETPIDKKDEKIVKKGVYFRSKNYVGRAKDKLGFQV